MPHTVTQDVNKLKLNTRLLKCHKKKHNNQENFVNMFQFSQCRHINHWKQSVSFQHDAILLGRLRAAYNEK